MKILLMSRYDSMGASSRIRSYQYLPFLREQGISVTVSPLFSNDYLSALYSKRTNWRQIFKGYTRRLLQLFKVYKYDLILIEKELFPFMPATAERVLRLLGIPYVVDYDDALFHRYDNHPQKFVRWLLGRKIDAVMRNATQVIAGNAYLANRAIQAGAKKVELIPTVIDLLRYQPKQKKYNNLPIIGWIGSPQTSHYLHKLLPVFAAIKKDYAVRFVAIGANSEDFKGSPVEVWPWTEDTEVSLIQQFDLALCP